MLRKRVDSHRYGTDQQLVGTLMFTAFCFLLPTVLVYYVYFSVIRLLLLIVYTLCNIVLVTVNHFPIYSFFYPITGTGASPPPHKQIQHPKLTSLLSLAGMSLHIRESAGEKCYLHIEVSKSSLFYSLTQPNRVPQCLLMQFSRDTSVICLARSLPFPLKNTNVSSSQVIVVPELSKRLPN